MCVTDQRCAELATQLALPALKRPANRRGGVVIQRGVVLPAAWSRRAFAAVVLLANAPQVVDWVTTDEGKKAIAGTNFDLEQGNMNLLKKRFVVENYSGK